MVPPAVNGPTLGVVFSERLGCKWARKDEVVYAVSLRLGFQGELNNGIMCMFEARDSSDMIALQLLTQYPPASMNDILRHGTKPAGQL